MYLIVVAMLLCPASSWIALGAAPLIARCEQNVCPSTCHPIILSLARRQALSSTR